VTEEVTEPDEDLVPPSSSGELSALGNTLTGDQSPTPIAPSRQVRRPNPAGKGHLKTALVAGFALVGGLIALAVGLALWLTR
jgi:hypothetical protein